ncbi:XkdX family protein [Paenibacillus sp. P96]|uniref:XkdX family protein n=1 Tax=Paenibacillus zeirhizosphaerae TaxID=2987519 RepID=A0ABT9FL73_9BACL|nr:XkdX family protein [Paenibacillus sp. P96]MDP4095481.1 XkdX family protein [Paenibacillus sp. P96]
MMFWQMAFVWGWVDADSLKGAVKTDVNPYGEITPDEYKTITGVDFAQ